MSNPHHTQGHTPKPGADTNAVKDSAVTEKQGEIKSNSGQDVEKVLKAGGEFDEKMKKLIPHPTKENIVAHFGKQEKFKNKTYEEILAGLEHDDALMAGWVKKSLTTAPAKQLNTPEAVAKASDAEIKKELAKHGYDDSVVKPSDEKTNKKIEANKTADLKGFTIIDKGKLQAGDIIIDQTGVVKAGSSIFRYNATKKKYESVNYATNVLDSSIKTDSDISEARMQDLKRFFKWHELKESEVNVPAAKPEEAKHGEPAPAEQPAEKPAEKPTDHGPAQSGKSVEQPAKPVEAQNLAPTQEPKPEKKPRKKRKIDINPFNRVRHLGTRAVNLAIGFPMRVSAKLGATVARPQDIFYKKYRTDMGKNLLRAPKALIKGVTGTFYRPHREKTEFEDVFKGYGPTRGPDAKKFGLIKKPLRFLGKPIKFLANYSRSGDHFRQEVIESVKNSKRHRNPQKRNFKNFKFTNTWDAFKKAFFRNHKSKTQEAEGKVVTMDNLDEVKKNAA